MDMQNFGWSTRCIIVYVKMVNILLLLKFLNRSFSDDITAAMLVYKKNPVKILFKLFSHVKTFFYSKKFAQLLTRGVKTIFY